MTTLIGIKADKGEKGIILASDLSRTETRWNPHGDVAYRRQTKSEGQKIYVNDNRDIALCMSGVFDQNYVNFLSGVLNGEVDVRKAIKEGYFPEFLELNLKRWNGKVPDSDYINGLLLSTRFDEPRLFTCYPLGLVEERAWTSIGSGSDYALDYISKQDRLIPKRISINEGIDLTVDALDKAGQDIHTAGLDLVVVEKDDIFEHGDLVKNAISNARDNTIKAIKKKYNEKY